MKKHDFVEKLRFIKQDFIALVLVLLAFGKLTTKFVSINNQLLMFISMFIDLNPDETFGRIYAPK